MHAPQALIPCWGQRQSSAWHQAANVLVFVAAVIIVLFGLIGGIAGLAVNLVNPSPDLVTATTVSVSLLVLTVGLGSTLAWQAMQAILGRASTPFEPRRPIVWVLLFIVALVGGQTVLSTGLLPAILLPIFHVAAAILPALCILGAVSRSLAGAASSREMVLQVNSGAFVSTTLAFSLEAMVLIALLMLVLLGIAIRPGGLEHLQGLVARMEDSTWIQDPSFIAPLAANPAVIGLALLVFSVIIPLIEESVKTLGVVMMAYRRPNIAQAYLWGLAGGLGFAVAEGLFNSASALDVWVFAVVTRAGATVMHAFTGALMGLAWYYALVERRWLKSLGLFGASVGLHGFWNALAAAVSLLSLALLGGETESAFVEGGSLGVVGIMALLVGLATVVALTLASLTRWVRRYSSELRLLHSSQANESQQLAS
jgi:hypothetical protein